MQVGKELGPSIGWGGFPSQVPSALGLGHQMLAVYTGREGSSSAQEGTSQLRKIPSLALPRHQGEPRGALHPPLPGKAWGKSCLVHSSGAAGARRDQADRKRVAGTRGRVRAARTRNNPGFAAACLALLSGSRRQRPGWPAPHCHHSPRWAIWDSRSCCCSGHTLAEFLRICSLRPFLPPLATVSHSSQLPPPLSPTRCLSHPICCDPCSRAAVSSAPAVPPLTQLWSAGPAAGPPPAASPSQCRLLAAGPPAASLLSVAEPAGPPPATPAAEPTNLTTKDLWLMALPPRT